ncbi:DNA polymerase III subunit gamma/tau [Hydrogenovibrio sp. SC-1]|uniref:DNA polymerase III subunit gamma/tau n=1 Tax=Hydrogenovibrio sp. SC-1 TaxID=2065820 RepID=UPI000C7DFFB6|nr:DNA polymerase III subunit gamma/tau [Hydrogenovibrio sp. SC-1]PLA75206.1 DNA polymerase III subunit gamma/tau [Hydrogenovibrio sp. SC-1]
MSDTVLARKWRPKNFSELVGQTHVMQALSNALDQQRLHHAYLFTGTRGVGKTTIARIFSKALNCEQGMSSTPCGVCSVCQSIDEGRFVDLIEVDAASKTKVEDTRELLENVQYAPVQGRYKVYLIDEVHMLSKSSFNALLKTLEEPPEHVKFLLATTDPHKLPMTVLSRCLQFNLMRLTQVQLQQHLAFILTQEAIAFDDAALAMIAKSADGSARDALSILDQAIAYGAGEVQHAAVQAMLGLVDQQFTLAILQALAQDSAEGIKQVVKQLAALGVDYVALNAQLIESLHSLSLIQVLGDAGETAILETDTLQTLAEQLAPERVQMCYQIALLAKQDMALAPDIRIGFEMALLRMLAFQLAEGDPEPSKMTRPGQNSVQNTGQEAPLTQPMNAAVNSVTIPSAPPQPMAEQTLPASESVSSQPNQQAVSAQQPSVQMVTEDDPIQALKKQLAATLGGADEKKTSANAPKVPPKTAAIQESQHNVAPEMAAAEPSHSFDAQPIMEQAIAPQSDTSSHLEQTVSSDVVWEPDLSASQLQDTGQPHPTIENWLQLIVELGLEGMAAELARQSILVRQTPQVLTLSVDPAQAQVALTELAFQRLEEQVKAQLGCRLEFEQASGPHWTPAKQSASDNEMRQQQARTAIEQDAKVQAFKQTLNLNVIESSIQPK